MGARAGGCRRTGRRGCSGACAGQSIGGRRRTGRRGRAGWGGGAAQGGVRGDRYRAEAEGGLEGRFRGCRGGSGGVLAAGRGRVREACGGPRRGRGVAGGRGAQAGEAGRRVRGLAAPGRSRAARGHRTCSRTRCLGRWPCLGGARGAPGLLAVRGLGVRLRSGRGAWGCRGARRDGGVPRFRAHAPPVSLVPGSVVVPGANRPARARIPARTDRHPLTRAPAVLACVRVTLRVVPGRTGTSPRGRGFSPERPPTLR